MKCHRIDAEDGLRLKIEGALDALTARDVRPIFDQVVAGLSQFAGYLKVGDPTEKETVVGPLISAAQRQRVLDHI